MQQFTRPRSGALHLLHSSALSRLSLAMLMCVVGASLLSSARQLDQRRSESVDEHTPSMPTYRAAAVDYAPVVMAAYSPTLVTRQQALDIMQANLVQLDSITATAVSSRAQIIVFPEDALYGPMFPTRDSVLPYLEYIPEITQQDGRDSRVCPCHDVAFADDSTAVLRNLSCMAISHSLVLVANMGEVRYCNGSHASAAEADCPADGRFQYNTQVVFDEQGYLLAKYHKSHLYYEPQWDRGDGVPVTFTTSFGVRFGLMICYDLMWPEPQSSLHAMGVRNFAFSAWWVNNEPTITGTTSQQAWSRLHQSNLIASSVGVNFYNSGSGVYSSGTALQACYNPDLMSRLCMAIGDLPLAPKPYLANDARPGDLSGQSDQLDLTDRISLPELPPLPQLTNIVTAIDPNYPGRVQELATRTNYSLTTTDASSLKPGSAGVLEAAQGAVHCFAEFEISPDSPKVDPTETYVLAALDGLYNELFNARICAFTRCASSGCLDWTTEASVLFDRAVVRMQVDPTAPPLPLQMLAMGDSNGAVLLPASRTAFSTSEIIAGAHHSAALHLDETQPPAHSLNDTLLNLSLFGVVWNELSV